jgi:protein-disulfide isomerase
VLIGVLVPLRMQCAEASSICRLDGVRHLFGVAPANDPRPAATHPAPPASPAITAAAQDAVPPRVPAAPVGKARVVVTMFIDWQCPACRAAHQSYAAVFDDFERSAPGAVTFVVKDFPLNSACNAGVPSAPHGAACEAAVAVRLAREKGREREMVEWIFANQEGLTPDGVKAALASLTGVTDFDGRYAEEIAKVRADADEGVGLHVQFTPSCYVNGMPTNQPNGKWLPPDELRAMIERELRKAGGPR